MKRRGDRTILAFVALALAAPAPAAAENAQQAFAKRWEGRTVVLKQPLYTLVYNERSRMGKTQAAKRDGLTVVTPFQGTYFQFDGRRGREHVTDAQPQRLIPSVKAAYLGESTFALEASQAIEPLIVNRHEPGMACVVRRIEIGRDTVRLVFGSANVAAGDPDPLTWLTVKWPVPLSKALTERDPIEALIGRFVEIKQTP